MSDDNGRFRVHLAPAGVGLGVFWFIWGHYGFWWGVLYGLFWPLWAGFKLAAFLVGGAR